MKLYMEDNINYIFSWVVPLQGRLDPIEMLYSRHTLFSMTICGHVKTLR